MRNNEMELPSAADFPHVVTAVEESLLENNVPELILEIEDLENDFTQVRNAIIRDKENLSYDALGLLVYLLSRPPKVGPDNHNWIIREKDLRRVGCGRNQVYRLLKVLRDTGYADRRPERDKNGTVVKVVYKVSDRRIYQLPRKQDVDNQDVEKQDVGFGTHSNTDGSNTDSSKTDKKEEAVALAPGASSGKKPNPHGRFANIIIDEFCLKSGESVPDGDGGMWGKNAARAAARIIAGSRGLAPDSPEEVLRRAAKKIVAAYHRLDRPFYAGHPFLKFCTNPTIAECLAAVLKEQRG